MYQHSRKSIVRAIVVLSVISAVLLLLLLPSLFNRSTPAKSATTSGDWTRFMYTDAHQGYNPNETVLSKANVGSLTLKWKFGGGFHFAAEPIVVNGVIYEGGLNGDMYAVSTATHKQLWAVSLGRYGSQNCPGTRGITGAALVENGLLYIGDGPNFYALNPANGSIVWQTPLGPNGNTFIWEGAALANGKVYVGVSSLCDNPLVPGVLYALDALGGRIVAQAPIVQSPLAGGGIWDTATIDANTGTIIVTTGSIGKVKLEPMEAAVVTLDWNTLAVKQFWQVPASQRIADADFGSTPTLFPGPNGKTYFGCINKNSIYYVFDEANVSAGPVWQAQLGPGGHTGGVDGSFASSSYVNGVLYIPTVLATVNGTSYGGSIGAFDALTGKRLWRFGTAGPIVGSIITANGLLFDSQGPTFEVRDMSNGSVLFSASYSNGHIFGAVTVLNGVVYLPSTDGHIYVLAPTM